ncbi:MAG: glycosyltransferase [Chloroflexi bacterium]|nr:glycosyltransferase [Chloroflexota bacterium]
MTEAPADVASAAAARAAARAARDWETADRLRGEIEAAGWKVVDAGTAYRLEPAHAPDVVADGRTRYGRSEAVPSRLAEPSTGVASVIVVATDHAADVLRAAAGIVAGAPEGTQLVIVGDGPAEQVETTLDELEATAAVVRTSARLGHAAALNIGLRRSTGPVIVILDPSVEATADFVTPLVRVLDDPTVAVTGAFGIVSRDLRHFDEAPAGDVDAIEGYCLAFRRADAIERGPLDEGFKFYRNLDIWWSFVLRDGGLSGPHRRAVAIEGLPLIRHEHRGWAALPDEERERLSRRNFYRFLDSFREREDLLTRRGRG